MQTEVLTGIRVGEMYYLDNCISTLELDIPVPLILSSQFTCLSYLSTAMPPDYVYLSEI